MSIVRRHVILGPGEYVGRLSRHSRCTVLVPAPDRRIQPIDVRDAATFVVDRAEALRVRGVQHRGAPGRETFGGFFNAAGR